jgi:hypothetical protein
MRINEDSNDVGRISWSEIMLCMGDIQRDFLLKIISKCSHPIGLHRNKIM